jgi:hypothetical protein
MTINIYASSPIISSSILGLPPRSNRPTRLSIINATVYLCYITSFSENIPKYRLLSPPNRGSLVSSHIQTSPAYTQRSCPGKIGQLASVILLRNKINSTEVSNICEMAQQVSPDFTL